jgi:hypothetical protein
MLGRGSFAECVTIYFKADMRQLIGDRNLSVVYVNHPELLGFFRFSITQDSGFLAVFSTISPEGTTNRNVGADVSVGRCAELVRTALGCGRDVPIAIDDIQHWSAAAGWAARFQDRRIFLAGDAAHVMPPTGGFGGNTGVGDAHNLAWKLAMVVQGTAGPELLSTYESERRPVAELIAEQAYTRYVLRVDPALPREHLAPPLDDASIELGPIYRSAAILGMDETAPGAAASLDDPRTPSGRPGTRAPHLNVERNGKAISTLDVFGQGFVLLAGSSGQAWCEAARTLADDLGVPLAAYRVGLDGKLIERDNRFGEAFGTGSDGAVIVRPDGIIAWRTMRTVSQPRVALEDVMAHLLFRVEAAMA